MGIFQIGKKKEEGSFPNHIALSVNGVSKFGKNNKIEVSRSWQKSFENIKEVINFQVEKDIPIFTFSLIPSKMVKNEDFEEISELIAGFFNELRTWNLVNEKKIKFSVIGKWYDLPNSLVTSIKNLTRETRDYDGFFVNFCANYDGQAEIVDAFRVLAMKIQNGTLDPESISGEDVKENLYSSYFIPPDLIIINAGIQSTSGLLLWDSSSSKIYFTDKLWPDFKVEYLAKIISRIFG